MNISGRPDRFDVEGPKTSENKEEILISRHAHALEAPLRAAGRLDGSLPVGCTVGAPIT